MRSRGDVRGGGALGGAASPGLSEKLFVRLGAFVEKQAGIRMPPEKRIMLQSRLQKRLRALGFERFEDYSEFLFSPAGQEQELQSMIDVVTTNKTDFFREPYHFEYLTRVALPELTARFGNRLRFWNAPCSEGHESYTLAMVLAEYAEAHPGFDFEIWGTDLSARVLDEARKAIYPHREVEPVPLALRKKYLLRGKAGNDLVRVVRRLREKVSFSQLNFMDERYRVGEPFHVIFCRNVLIYFERSLQQTVVNRLVDCMHPGGLFLTGHSETLNGFNTLLKQREPTVYWLPSNESRYEF